MTLHIQSWEKKEIFKGRTAYRGSCDDQKPKAKLKNKKHRSLDQQDSATYVLLHPFSKLLTLARLLNHSAALSKLLCSGVIT